MVLQSDHTRGAALPNLIAKNISLGRTILPGLQHNAVFVRVKFWMSSPFARNFLKVFQNLKTLGSKMIKNTTFFLSSSLPPLSFSLQQSCLFTDHVLTVREFRRSRCPHCRLIYLPCRLKDSSPILMFKFWNGYPYAWRGSVWMEQLTVWIFNRSKIGLVPRINAVLNKNFLNIPSPSATKRKLRGQNFLNRHGN